MPSLPPSQGSVTLKAGMPHRLPTPVAKEMFFFFYRRQVDFVYVIPMIFINCVVSYFQIYQVREKRIPILGVDI